MLISVVIPVYNGEKYIIETVESIIIQEYKNVEIILINDGSTDNSDCLCQSLSENYSNVIYYKKENEGIGATRNYGIEKSNGKYIVFLDQDDVWVRDFLSEEIVEKIQNGGDIVGFSYYRCNHDFTRGKEVRVQNKVIEGGGVRAINSSWNHHSSMFFSKEMLTNFGLKYPTTRHEDEIFRHKCLYISRKVTYIDKMMFLYRNNPLSETHRKQSPETLYVPILDSWKKTIAWHEDISPNDRESIRLCKNIICVYGIEGIEALYQYGMDDKSAVKIIDEEFPTDILKQFSMIECDKKTQHRLEMYYYKHNKFIICNRLRGRITDILKGIVSVKFIRYIRDVKRYPVLMEKRNE